ncbi:MAG TPA: trimethylamine--corrinoid methyltransferase, partial [Synergistaceae bacterium]|nr:trimethylamine--corrinoid methyltransferase [Synergistaceae bacterium]
VFDVEGHPGMKCHIEEEVFQWMEEAGPMPEGDYLFMVEGVGRLRFSIV